MRGRVVTIVFGSALVLSIAGCTTSPGAPQTTAEPSTPSPSASAPETSGPAQLPDPASADGEGRLEATAGEAVAVLDDDGEQLGSVALLDVEQDFVCDSGIDEPPVNGGFIGLRFAAHANEVAEMTRALRLSSDHLSGYAADGEYIPDITGNGYLCAEDAIGPRLPESEDATGWIVLDAPPSIAFLTFEADPAHDLEWMWSLAS